MDPVQSDPGQDGPANSALSEIERQIMSATVVDKTWEVPAHSGKGPVTITLRIPEVTITDSQGRHIVIAPEQADIVSSKLSDIACWIHDAAEIDDGAGD